MAFAVDQITTDAVNSIAFGAAATDQAVQRLNQIADLVNRNGGTALFAAELNRLNTGNAAEMATLYDAMYAIVDSQGRAEEVTARAALDP